MKIISLNYKSITFHRICNDFIICTLCMQIGIFNPHRPATELLKNVRTKERDNYWNKSFWYIGASFLGFLNHFYSFCLAFIYWNLYKQIQNAQLTEKKRKVKLIYKICTSKINQISITAEIKWHFIIGLLSQRSVRKSRMLNILQRALNYFKRNTSSRQPVSLSQSTFLYNSMIRNHNLHINSVM